MYREFRNGADAASLTTRTELIAYCYPRVANNSRVDIAQLRFFGSAW